jgi:transcriptional activator SPT7
MSMPPFPSYSHTSSTSSRLSTGGDNDDGIASTTSSHLPQYKDTTLPEPANVEPEHIEEDHQRALFRELYQRSEARIATLFSKDGTQAEEARELVDEAIAPASGSQEEAKSEGLTKKPARTIDEDDYDDDDDDDGENEEGAQSPKKIAVALLSPSKSGSSPPPPDPSPQSKATDKDKQDATIIAPKSSEDARRQLEEAKKATEDAVKRSLSSMFWLLDSDKLAMQEQQKLEESEKQIDAEMNRHPTSNPEQHGTLSSANLGASSLTLKHLIARIDLKRDQVLASDAELRSLMNEVRKNRSKWASEENVGQEELYEAAEKVLSELKAMTEYSAPFLTRVNKREAPDYYNSKSFTIKECTSANSGIVIKHPMDLGSMTKKLKGLQYKSKAEFVADLDLIWSNCLRYNQDLSHPLRRNANSMRKEAEKLVPLIPDIVVRPRAEVEAEERKKQNGNEDDGGDESDDEPIMSSMSRGRKAPGKTGGKGASKARKSVPGHDEGTPGVEQKPMLHLNGTIANLIHENSDVNMDGSQNGSATPPIGGTGSVTPGGFNVHGTGSHSDAMDIDGPSMNGVALGQALGAAAEELQEDEDYKIWKQVTKKDRAIVARERNKLFRGDKLNPDEPALLRTKAGMRRWVRQQKQAMADGLTGESRVDAAIRADKEPAQGAETLAEGMEAEEERVLPDYYDPLSAIPDIPERLQWVEDADGQVIDQSADFLRVVPKGYFTAPQSALSSRIEANMRQMQETRKICSKIGIVKQMQLQSQVCIFERRLTFRANDVDVQQPVPEVQSGTFRGGRHRASYHV